jgi:hypothetical protein
MLTIPTRHLLTATVLVTAMGSVTACAPGRADRRGGTSTIPEPWQSPRISKLTPPLRAATEVVGVDARVSDRWLTVATGILGNEDPDTPDTLHVYRRSGGAWVYDAALTAPQPQPSDGFGGSAGIDGDTIIVGAPTRNAVDAPLAGAAYVFRRDGETWKHHATLECPNPVERGFFGNHVALDGDTAVVGEAIGGHMEGGASNRAVYVYAREGDSWPLQATIELPDELAGAAGKDNEFGNFVAVQGDTLAVTAMGADALYMYERRRGRWSLAERIDAPRAANDSEGGPAFGRTVDLDLDLMVVGALRAGGVAPDAGAAFVYRRAESGARWELDAKLVAPDGRTLDMFGHWVAIAGDTILAAAFRAANAGRPEAGTAYLFRRSAGPVADSRWRMIGRLDPPPAESPTLTAYTADLADGTVVLSAGDTGNPAGGGHVWVVEPAGGRVAASHIGADRHSIAP